MMIAMCRCIGAPYYSVLIYIADSNKSRLRRVVFNVWFFSTRSSLLVPFLTGDVDDDRGGGWVVGAVVAGRRLSAAVVVAVGWREL